MGWQLYSKIRGLQRDCHLIRPPEVFNNDLHSKVLISFRQLINCQVDTVTAQTIAQCTLQEGATLIR